MNPLLPRKHFVPDAEARVMPDGKLYLYGSYDISGCKDYCSKDYHVFVCEDEKQEQRVKREQQESEQLTKALTEVQAAKTRDELTVVWNRYPTLKPNADFINAVTNRGKEVAA